MEELEESQPFQISNCVNFFSKLILNSLMTQGITCWIGGGAVRDYFMSRRPMQDIDLFFPDQDNFDRTKFYFSDVSKTLYENENVLKIEYKGRKIDLVKKFFTDPRECINAFDFTVSCIAVDINDVYYHPTFFMDLAKRSLVIHRLLYPISTLSRLQKYILKGFTICRGGILKIAEAIQKEGINNPTFLTDSILEFYDDGTPIFRGID